MLTDPSNHEAGYLRVAHNDRVQAEAMAGFAYTELAATASAIIRQDDPYSAALLRVGRHAAGWIATILEEAGLVEIVAEEPAKLRLRP